MRHQQPAGARLRQRDRGRQVGIDALAVAHEVGELLAHGLQLVEAGLLGVPQGGTDHHVGHIEDAQRVGERRVAVQRAADVLGGVRVR